MRVPTKTFGIVNPTRLLFKLEFDTARLSAATSSREQQYAALDCAVWNWHMVDWVLATAKDDHHLELAGVARKSGKNPGVKFAERNAHRLPDLAICQQIANTGKHLVLTLSPDDPSFRTASSVKFDPPIPIEGPIPPGFSATPIIFIAQENGIRRDARLMFEGLARNWRVFLIDEDLFDYDEAHGNE